MARLDATTFVQFVADELATAEIAASLDKEGNTDAGKSAKKRADFLRRVYVVDNGRTTRVFVSYPVPSVPKGLLLPE